MERGGKSVLILISLMVAATFASTAWLFLIKKDYPFIVEAPCDTSTNTCFVRDCSEGDCPVNELESYRVYEISAADFPTCADGTCVNECSTKSISCIEILCGDSEEDTCSASEVSPDEEDSAQ